MSVRAYRVITKELAKDASFHLSGNDWVLEYATQGENSGDCVEFVKTYIEEGLKVEKDEHKRGVLSTILLDCGKDDFVEYECF